MAKQKRLYSNEIVIFLVAFFSHAVINFVGEISPSFLFILFTLPAWISQIDFKKEKNIQKIVQIFGLIICIQIIWAIIHSSTDMITQIKGIMITVYGLFFLLFYYQASLQNRKALIAYFFAELMASFFFSNMISMRDGERSSDYSIWKFQVYPRIVVFTILISLLRKSRPYERFSPIMFISVGALGILTGARSSGLIPFLAGVVTLFVTRKGVNGISVARVRKTFVAASVVFYLAFSLIYVPMVMNSSIEEGNSKQLLKATNPYNPINLLIIGRSDAIVPFVAFFDNPFLGWGYKAKDPGYKYHLMAEALSDAGKTDDRYDEIPDHSLLGYFCCSYGIVMLLVWLCLIKIIFSIYEKILTYNGKYTLLASYLLVSLVWTVLFSPMPSLKLSLGSTIAFLIYIEIASKNDVIQRSKA